MLNDTEISPIELISFKIVFLVKKRNKGRRRSGLFNDIGIFTNEKEIDKFLVDIGGSRDEYKVIPFTLNKSKYHLN